MAKATPQQRTIRMDTMPAINRRRMLGTFANGFGVLGLASLLAEEGRGKEATSSNPLAALDPRRRQRASSE